MSATGQADSGQPNPTPDAPAEGATTETPAEGQGTGGLDRLYERMDQMNTQQQELLRTVRERFEPEEEEEPEEDFDLYTDEGELTEEGARALIRDLVNEQVTSALAPREKAMLIERRDEAFEALREEHPELQDQATADAVLAKAIGWAKRINPEIIDRPEFVDVIEAFYKADKYEDVRKTQAAEQPRSVVLESGSGGGRQQRANDPDWGDRIVKAAERLRPSI